MALAGVKKAADELKRKRALAAAGGKNWLKIAPGEEVTVRPLEQDEDFRTCYVHSVPFKREGGGPGWRDAVCLDQDQVGTPCPGCEEREKISDPKNDRRFARRFKFYLNVIWRDGPIFQRDEEKKIVRNSKNEPIVERRGDVLALWSGGIRAAEELDHANDKYAGLTSRDFTIERDGEGLDTKYRIAPAVDKDGDTIPKSPLSKADEKIAENRYDLAELVTPGSFDDFFGDRGGSGGDGPSDAETKRTESPFRKRRDQ